tara:strand:+ start:19973 stop:20977 length:1005 start_codon:yes stop_codon:yes gene_type:complete
MFEEEDNKSTLSKQIENIEGNLMEFFGPEGMKRGRDGGELSGRPGDFYSGVEKYGADLYDYYPTASYPSEDQNSSARLVSDANKFVALNKASEILDEGDWDTHRYETPIGKVMQQHHGDKVLEGDLDVTDVVKGINYHDRRYSRKYRRRMPSKIEGTADRLAYMEANPYSRLNEPNTHLTDNDMYALEEFSKYNPEMYLDYIQQRTDAWKGFFDYAEKNPGVFDYEEKNFETGESKLIKRDPIMLEYRGDEYHKSNKSLMYKYEKMMEEEAANKKANDEASNHILRESILQDNLGSKLEQKLFTLGVMKDNMAHKIADGLDQLSLLVDDEEEIV